MVSFKKYVHRGGGRGTLKSEQNEQGEGGSTH